MRSTGHFRGSTNDAYHLDRFVAAQEPVYNKVLAELASGRKRSHWMWYIFPQIKGLGYSATAQRFAISSRAEAEAYADHSALGPRLRECTQYVIAAAAPTIGQIFGYPDDLKFHSCMTLFMASTSDNELFKAALTRYFEGKPDQKTLDLLGYRQARG